MNDASRKRVAEALGHLIRLLDDGVPLNDAESTMQTVEVLLDLACEDADAPQAVHGAASHLTGVSLCTGEPRTHHALMDAWAAAKCARNRLETLGIEPIK